MFPNRCPSPTLWLENPFKLQLSALSSPFYHQNSRCITHLVHITKSSKLKMFHAASLTHTGDNHQSKCFVPYQLLLFSLSPAPDKLPLTTLPTAISIKTPFRNQCRDDKVKGAILLTDYGLLPHDCTLALK